MHLLRFALVALLLVFFSCFLYAEVLEEEDEDYEDWLIMEGPGLVFVADAPRQEQREAKVALPERSALGSRRNIVSEEQIKQQGSIDFSDTLRNVPGVIVGQRNLGEPPPAPAFLCGGGALRTLQRKSSLTLTAFPASALSTDNQWLMEYHLTQ